MFHFRCAGYGEDKVPSKVLVNVSKMSDEVIIAETTKSPVD